MGIPSSSSYFKGLRLEAGQILKSLTEKGDGNQFMVILNLSAPTIKKLDEEHHSFPTRVNNSFSTTPTIMTQASNGQKGLLVTNLYPETGSEST
jgi:hypothetical protein